MGFFKSIFNTPKKEDAQVPKSPPLISKLPPLQQIGSYNTESSKSPSPPLSQRQSLDNNPRFRVYEDGSHSHHLTLPSQSKIAASLNEFVSGFANKSIRLATPWAETKMCIDDIQKERALLNQRLNRKMDEKTVVDKWGTCQGVIGRGASGVVRVAHKIDSSEKLYAVKELRKQSHESSKQYVERLIAEFCLSATMEHINIIQTFDLLPLDPTSPIFCQVMEYSGGGDLFDVLSESPDGLAKQEANCYFKQLIRGVQYLHNNGVAHRDIKPENLLLTSTGCLKITDFGCAVCFRGTTLDENGEEQPGDEDKMHLTQGLVGSEPYIAPEEFESEEYDARLVDIWSCGIVYMSMRKANRLWNKAKKGDDEEYDKYLKFRQLLDEERENTRRALNIRKGSEMNMTEEERVRERAKREASVLRAREAIRKRAKEGNFDTLEGIDIQAKKVIYRMLDPQPSRRLTADQVLQTEWCTNIDCCQKDTF